jgi:hypothetical protein
MLLCLEWKEESSVFQVVAYSVFRLGFALQKMPLVHAGDNLLDRFLYPCLSVSLMERLRLPDYQVSSTSTTSDNKFPVTSTTSPPSPLTKVL